MFSSLMLSMSKRSFAWPNCPACLVATISFWLSGCAAIQVHILQSKVYLNTVPATSMAVSLPNGSGIAPGEKLPLVVTFTTADGKVFVTEGAGHGKVLWQDLKLSATVASVNDKGVLSLPADPRLSEGKLPHVTITAPTHPDLKAELDVPVRYDRSFAATFTGSTGSDGLNGNDGMDGTSGTMGSFDPNNPQAGGNGSDGTNGTDGQNGEDGGDGPPVHVRVTTLRPGPQPPLLQVAVEAESKVTMFLVDPNGGSLTIKSLGGGGGQGGKGGRGGRGGSGGAGVPDGQSGRDGLDGHDGFSGTPGRGGAITVIYDPKVKPFLSAIRVPRSNGPPSVFREEPIGPLW